MKSNLRYKSTGEVHKDFHGLTCATLHYLIDNYGMESVREILKNTAQKVYKTMHLALMSGDCSELTEWWKYYLDREGGVFSVEGQGDGVRLVVRDCPALRHLVKLGQMPDPVLCEATCIFNEALAEGSPFAVEFERTGDFSCVQAFRRREGDA